jgi:hypothetical protein
MEYQKLGQTYVLRLEVGEEIISRLTDFCKQQRIEAGKVTGIGVARRAKISYFDLESGDYRHRELTGNMEITSLVGNISMMDGEPLPHLHVNLADENYQLLGGHLSAAEIGVTGELVLEPLEGTLQRKVFPETGQRLLALQD